MRLGLFAKIPAARWDYDSDEGYLRVFPHGDTEGGESTCNQGADRLFVVRKGYIVATNKPKSRERPARACSACKRKAIHFYLGQELL